MKELETGLSGCKLELIEPSVIRKYSSNIQYNLRLKSQINKQKLFSNLILKNIDTPKIIQTSYQELYYFDMEYVSGQSFHEYFSTSNIDDINFVISSLFNYFDTLIKNKKYYKSDVSSKRILEKINSLESSTNFKKHLSFLKKIVEGTNLHIPQTFCHGDLTFTNIIFHKNRLYFIDFLDCFIDSFLIDLVKLKQDLFYFWSLENQNIQSIRIRQIYSFIWKSIQEKYIEYISTTEFKILDFLNSLRLEPYLTDERQRLIMSKMLKACNLYEYSHCPDGGTFL